MNIDKLMMKREQFPSITYKNNRGLECFDLIQLPPYHPSMADGIDVDLAVSVVDKAVENTVLDLEDAVKNMPYFRDDLEAFRNTETGESYENEEGKLIYPFPFMKTLLVGSKKISPSGGDHYISIRERKKHSLYIPLDLELSPELIEEYQLKEEGKNRDFKRFSSHFTWSYHNLGDIRGLFFKNFIIAINNAVIDRKYGEIK
jgi:hypothetical protein